jgi:integrase
MSPRPVKKIQYLVENIFLDSGVVDEEALYRTIYVDWEAGTVAVHGRRKGKGTAGRIVPLTPAGVKALKAMHREDAWGTFSRATLRVVFQRACAKAGLKGDDFTPYDLRHSFGTEIYLASGDIRATQVLMGHSSATLTHRYTLAAVDPRVARALKQWGKRLR